MRMRQLHNGAQVGANAVIGRIIHQHGLGIGIGLDGLFYLAKLHAQRNAQLAIHIGINIYRNRTI